MHIYLDQSLDGNGVVFERLSSIAVAEMLGVSVSMCTFVPVKQVNCGFTWPMLMTVRSALVSINDANSPAIR